MLSPDFNGGTAKQDWPGHTSDTPGIGRLLLRRVARWATGLSLAALVAFVVLWFACPFPLERLDGRPPSLLVLDRDGHIIRAYIAADDQWRFPVPYEAISPWLIQATVAVEDGRFWDHQGVDVLAVGRAAVQNLSCGRVVSGASTLTMQTVRLMDNRRRTMTAKVVEAFRALQLERLRGKREILTAYLNSAPYGSNLEGVEAAALVWFGKHAADLTLAESALVAGLPQAPSRYRPDRHPERALARQRFVLGEMRRRGMISQAQLDEALAQPIDVTRRPFPLRAPHLCDLVAARHAGWTCSVPRPVCLCVSARRQVSSGRAAREPGRNPAGQDRPGHTGGHGPGMLSPDFAPRRGSVERVSGFGFQVSGPGTWAPFSRRPAPDTGHPFFAPCASLRTTIDLGLQTVTERALRDRLAALADRDVANGAAVVIENRTGAVRALVGSADYRRPEVGQFNAAVALRSPGSALKPFTYALAFEAGLATPDTILADTPVHFAGYQPENYDREFRGPVTARSALADSLNIPALRLADRLGAERLRQFLTDCGLRTLNRPAAHYGLALTLGSAEVRLLELTNAYACLGRLGEYRPYRLLEDEPVENGVRHPDVKVSDPVSRRVVSAGAAFLVLDCLKSGDSTGRPAPALAGTPGMRSPDFPTIAWKTGTSTGRRDAWTIATNPDYTVGVWLGNFDGHGAPGLSGIDAAAPVVFEIFRELYRDRPWTWYPPPAEVARRDVCPLSGEPVGPLCPSRQSSPYLVGRSSNTPCRVHRTILVDAETGHQLCPLCSGGRPAQWQPAVVFPPDLARWLTAHGHSVPAQPPHRPGCPGSGAEGRVAILSPADGQRFVWMPDQPADGQRIDLRAAAAPDADSLCWFVNGTLVARCAPADTPTWPLSRGRHQLRCVDVRGRSATIHITVE